MRNRLALQRLTLVVLALAQLGCGRRAEDPPPDAKPRTGAAPKPISLTPPEDRERSAYTGWTRAHYESVFARLLLGFVDHRTPAGARTRYPGGERLPAAMEGAIRMLPALGAWLACPCNPNRILVAGRELDVAAIARTIVIAGTDPNSPDYWHPIPGGWNQREVEASTVAQFLLRSRARVWDRLSAIEQARIMAWLEPAEDPLAANWLAFQIARNSARAALGRSIPEAALREQLDRLEADYVGDGFYRDGHRHRFDWYNAFVVHPELSFWRSVGAPVDPDPQRIARVARRTAAFLGHLPYLFDAEGRIAPIGRSLAYRSAVLAGLHASVLAGDGFVEPGLARRVSAGNLRFHDRAGMFDDDFVLTRGYHGEQPGVRENYIRPGSQYFLSRALAVLALPPEHPFWAAKEQPLPADRGDFVHAIPAIGWMLEHDADGAGLTLHNAGSSTSKSAHHDKYAKLGYPAQTWFARSSAKLRPYDAAIVSATRAKFWRGRSGPRARAVAPGFAWLRYGIAPELGGRAAHEVSTAALADPDWIGPETLRLSCLSPSAVEPARAYEGSYAIALGPAPRAAGSSSGGASSGSSGETWAYLDSGERAPSWGAGAVLLAGLTGWERAERGLDYPAVPEHVLGGPAGFIGLGVREPFASRRCFASLQVLDDQPFDPAPLLAAAPKVRFEGTQAWIEGYAETEAWVELAAVPPERSVELGRLRASGPLRLLWTDRRELGAEAKAEVGRRIVAVGLRELADESGPLLEATGGPRGLLACELAEASLRCELDGPISVRRPHADALELRTRDALWTGEQPRWRSRLQIPAAGPEWIPIPVELDEARVVVIELE